MYISIVKLNKLKQLKEKKLKILCRWSKMQYSNIVKDDIIMMVCIETSNYHASKEIEHNRIFDSVFVN